MTYEHILVDRPADHVVRLTLHRPSAANAINQQMLAELEDAVREIAANDDVHAWILTGSPRLDGREWFSAGVDMKEALAGFTGPRVSGARVCDQIDDLLKPSIAAIGGVCTTGALELVLACDIRIVSRSAEISDFHMLRSGMAIGAWGVAARLSRLVGVAKAKELLLMSSTVRGDEAARIGLANRSVEAESLASEAVTVAATIAGMPRRGVRATLGYLSMQADLPLREAIHLGDRTPELMGMKLRPFSDAAARFFDGRDQPAANAGIDSLPGPADSTAGRGE
jgi:enoyl-CoA hydratase